MSKDPNYVVKIEQAIAKKYGELAVQNPKKTWTEEKDQEYFEQLKEFYRHQRQEEDYDKKEVNGVFIPKKLLNSDSNRSCPVCSVYTTKAQDDLYFTKFDCCFKCYVQWVEGREERWKTGWRPNNETND